MLQGEARNEIPSRTQAVTEPGKVEEALEASERDVDAWLESGLDVRSVLDDHYPHYLRTTFDYPPLLFLEGEWKEPEDFRAVSVVGTREPSEAGVRRARRLVRELADAKVTVLSGLAAGIDTVAHETALDHGTRTVAVMGTGLDHRYPAQNRDLARRIIEAGGALITKFFPHQKPARWTFLERNVLMSGLGIGTVVVEAGESSGSKHQALAALKHARAVFFLQSLVEDRSWARKLVEQGEHGVKARTVSSTQQILHAVDGQSVVP